MSGGRAAGPADSGGPDGPDGAPAGRDAATGGPRETDPRSDHDLLRAHLDGDTGAFAILVRRHRDRLWAVALRTAGHPEDAADALQDALVSAFRRAGSFRGDAAVTTWLHRVVVNACLDRHRRNAVRATEPLPEDLEARLGRGRETPTTAVADPAQQVLQAERRAQVHAALRALPEEQRLALVLVDLEQWSVAEAAEALGVRPGTVKSRCHRGRARLAELLADLAPEVSRGRGTGSPSPTSDPGGGEASVGTPESRGGEHP